ncbi:uncharacterized protein [Procambarus clarkii]|uniref:uncharacterized protein n=1 Tax=Procambarus clarkii TaxID=6728 RepID=UPI0037445570
MGRKKRASREVSLPLYRDDTDLYVSVRLDGQPVHFVVDTGAKYTIVTVPFMKEYGLEAVMGKDFKRLDKMESIDINDNEWKQMDFSKFFKGVLKAKPYFRCANLSLDAEIYVDDIASNDALLAMDILVAHNCSIINDMKNPRLIIRPVKEHKLQDNTKYFVTNYNSIRIKTKINGKRAKALLDTGAPISTISRRRARKLGLKIETCEVQGVQNLDDKTLRTKHVIRNAEIKFQGLTFHTDVYILQVYDAEYIIGDDILRYTNITFTAEKAVLERNSNPYPHQG